MATNGMSWTDKNLKWLLAFGFFGTFVYVWAVVQPPLIFQQQQPVFFTGADFLAKSLSYPGGLADYLSAFLTHFFQMPILGALIITLLIAAITLAARVIFREFKLGEFSPLLTVLLFGLLVSVHSSYFYTLSFSLALLFTLAAFLLLLKLARNRFILRIILFSILARFLYFIIAAPFLLFVVLVIFYQLLLTQDSVVKKIIATSIFVLTAVFWPMIVHSYFLLFDRSAIFTYLLPIRLLSSFQIKLQIVYLLLILAPFLGGMLYHFKGKVMFAVKSRPAQEAVVMAVLFVIIAILAGTSFDPKHRLVLKIDRLAEHREWEELLTLGREHQDVLNRLVTFQYDRALYHTGELLDNLFSYPQIEGEKGLFRNSGPAFEMPYAVACLMFEMGNPNSAQTWANEAMNIEGQSVRILKLLALIHIYKDENAAAHIYLNKLAKSFGAAQWVAHYEQVMTEPYRIKNDPIFSTVETAQIRDNFLFRFGDSFGELEFLNKHSTPSKMAFEYLLAYNLLARRLDRVAEMAPHILQLPYRTIPRHVEEALILIAMSGVTFNVDLNAFDFSANMVQDLETFMSIIEKHNQNPQYAQAELLQSFGDTYWYYHIFHQAQELN